MKKQTLVLTGLLLVSPFLPARAAEMVKDLNPGPAVFDSTGSTPLPGALFRSYTPVRDGRAIFLAFLPSDGIEWQISQCGLWVTDGTSEGTERLVELCGEDTGDRGPTPRVLATNGSVALFTDSHNRIWRTDGTPAGTFPLGTVTAGELILVGPDGRTFFFVGCTRPFGCEPWRSDGTREETAMIRDLRPGRGSSDVSELLRDGGRLLMVANSSHSLWATDGTAAGTLELVRLPKGEIEWVLPSRGQIFLTVFVYPGKSEVWRIGPAPGSARRVLSFPSGYWRFSGLEIREAGGRLFLTVYDAYNYETTLWETDGTSRGTHRLARFAGFLLDLYTLGGRVVFAAAREESSPPQFWYLDPGMTRPRRLGGPGLVPEHLLHFGNRLFFISDDPQRGSELWTTDGSRGGTRSVQLLCAGICEPKRLLSLRTALGRLFYTDEEGLLWTTDAAGKETAFVARLAPLRYSGDLDLAPLAGGRIVFSGFDERDGRQPWVSDLTPGGASRILQLGATLAAGGRILSLTRFGDKVLFTGCDGESFGVFGSDGTAAGTVLLSSTEAAGEEPCTTYGPWTQITVLGNVALFTLEGKLWRTDGTPGGTSPLLGPDILLRVMERLGDRFLFVLEPPERGEWVWKFWTSDGTEAGTRQAFELPLGGTPTGFVSVGGEVFFIAQSTESPSPYTLWRTDGTEAGTRKLAEVDDPTSGAPIEAVRLGGRTILALIRGSGRPIELWVTDGTAAGTVPLIADPAAPGPKNPFALTVFKDAAWFFTGTGDPGEPLGEPFALWRSDGTAAGTRLVKTLSPPQTGYGFLAPLLTPVGDTLFFRADDGVHGTELWKTDGTTEGTVRVGDIARGPAHSHPFALTAFEGKLRFAATDQVHGLELWESDGTAEGTRLVEDIFPGPNSSAPEQLTAVPGKLFFTANDGVHGRELWLQASPP